MDRNGCSNEYDDVVTEIANMSSDIEPYFPNSISSSLPCTLVNHVTSAITKPIMISKGIRAQKEIELKRLDVAEKVKIAELQHRNLEIVMTTVQVLVQTGNFTPEAMDFIRDCYDNTVD